jgi:hypothetical protein
MSTEPKKIIVSLSSEEQAAIQELQQEMGLADAEDVMQMLLRQASQRALVVCPSCGHSAQRNALDDATCNSCMSVLHLSDGIWEVIQTQ